MRRSYGGKPILKHGKGEPGPLRDVEEKGKAADGNRLKKTTIPTAGAGTEK